MHISRLMCRSKRRDRVTVYKGLLCPLEDHIELLLHNRLEVDAHEAVTSRVVCERVVRPRIACATQFEEYSEGAPFLGDFGRRNVDRIWVGIRGVYLTARVDTLNGDSVAAVGSDPSPFLITPISPLKNGLPRSSDGIWALFARRRGRGARHFCRGRNGD